MTRRIVILHALGVILLGLVAGFFWGAALVENWSGEAQRAWRLAHLEGIANGALIIPLALATALSAASPRLIGAIHWALVITAWCNIAASLLAALSGTRGLEFAPPAANMLVYGIFSVGILAILFALGALGYALLRHPRGEEEQSGKIAEEME